MAKRNLLIGMTALAFSLALSVHAAEMARVIFSYGKIEVLRDGAKEWDFVRVGAVLSDNDRVRMPPTSLLRLSKSDGTQFGAVTGNREVPASLLLREAALKKINSGTGERPVLDGSEAHGDPARTTDVAPITTFSDKEFNQWKSDARSKNPLVKKEAQTALANVRPTQAGIYPTLRLRQAQALYDAGMEALKAQGGLASLFPDKATAPLYLVSALCDAAGIPTRRTLDENKRPLLLVELDIPTGEWKRVTANRNLVTTTPSGQAYLPLHPTAQAKTLLEAWFAVEGMKNNSTIARP